MESKKQFGKQLEQFLEGHGFYMVMLLCAVIIGVSIWSLLKKPADFSPDEPEFDENDVETRQVKLLHRRINRLQPFDRAIVLLWLENMSYDDIAAIVGITTKAVGVRLVRIREQLKQMNDNTSK